jgi:hypothetical protein
MRENDGSSANEFPSAGLQTGQKNVTDLVDVKQRWNISRSKLENNYFQRLSNKRIEVNGDQSVDCVPKAVPDREIAIGDCQGNLGERAKNRHEKIWGSAEAFQ